MSGSSDDGPALDDQNGATDSVRPSERAKPLSPEKLDRMRRFQEAGVEMAMDEECRIAIAARLF